MKYLIVVDMQNDFVDGALGTKEAEKIVHGVAEKTAILMAGYCIQRIRMKIIIWRRRKGKNFRLRIASVGTKGWELVPEITKLAEAAGNSEGANEIEKPTFGSVELGKLLARENEKEPIDSITLVGLCTVSASYPMPC